MFYLRKLGIKVDIFLIEYAKIPSPIITVNASVSDCIVGNSDSDSGEGVVGLGVGLGVDVSSGVAVGSISTM